MRYRYSVAGLHPSNFYHHGWPMSSAPVAPIENLEPESKNPIANAVDSIFLASEIL
jgi:hypothetical protein